MNMSNISQKLDLRQSQHLVMTPQLQQAIKLLQMNNIELNDFIEAEIEKNPLLEKQEAAPEESGETESHTEESKDEIEAAFESPDNSDFDSGSSMADMGSGGNSKFDTMDDNFENRVSDEKTLREHLMEQLFLDYANERDRMVGCLLIDHLDESGYLRQDIDELAEKIGCSPERIENLLTQMKQFDPTGVFAKDLQECFTLQLEEQGKLDAPMKAFLQYMDMLADHDFKGLADKCGVNETYLMDMVEEIKTLNPKPAGEFDHLVIQTAIPDVLMKRLPKNIGGGWRVELNHETLPRILVQNEYVAEISARAKTKEDKSYVSEQLASANWLVRALDQRAQTILKVASAIVEHQDAFFNYGIEFLQPLTLKEVADEIEMHESTVSRVTNNKYIGTPRGLFELKFFFTTALVSEGGIAHSAEAIKAKIKSLIDSEDPKKILSDDKIVAILKEEGIDLARRTVAKYREAMHIGSSVARRKQKKTRIKD